MVVALLPGQIPLLPAQAVFSPSVRMRASVSSRLSHCQSFSFPPFQWIGSGVYRVFFYNPLMGL